MKQFNKKTFHPISEIQFCIKKKSFDIQNGTESQH